jgi:molybdopterin-guanine dinucleotide biosynthesis protein A
LNGGSVLGAVLAGGRSTRYGSPKALAEVGGERIVDRVIGALRPVTGDIILIANDPALASVAKLPWRRDEIADLGALGGIHTALLWAREQDRKGILAVACDMPFLSPQLLRRLVERGTGPSAPDVVAPTSGGRRGIEPLCSYYAVTCIAAIESAIAAGDHRMIGFHDRLTVEHLTLDEVETFGSPDVLFLNVNSPEDRERAERLEQQLKVESRKSNVES